MTTTMTTRPALDRLADRASIREFAAPKAWEWEWRRNGVVVTSDVHDNPIRLVVDGEEVDFDADGLRTRIRHAHAEVGQDLMSMVGMAPEGVTVEVEEYGRGHQWIYRRGTAEAFSSDSRLIGDPGIIGDFRAAGRRWIHGLTLPAPVA